MIFDDFFKLLLDGPRWYFRYVEMFLEPPEGILSPRIHFRPILERHQTNTFSSHNTHAPQYWGACVLWEENVFVWCRSRIGLKCILGLKIPSGGSKNISTYLKYHLGPSRSSLKKSSKITFRGHFPFFTYQGPKGPKYGLIGWIFDHFFEFLKLESIRNTF